MPWQLTYTMNNNNNNNNNTRWKKESSLFSINGKVGQIFFFIKFHCGTYLKSYYSKEVAWNMHMRVMDKSLCACSSFHTTLLPSFLTWCSFFVVVYSYIQLEQQLNYTNATFSTRMRMLLFFTFPFTASAARNHIFLGLKGILRF